jgi:hypothetical protein
LLSFNSNLTTHIAGTETKVFWYLKLYYGDETSFTGVSDTDRTISTVNYYGVVSSWNNLNSRLDVQNFSAGQSVFSVNIINTDNTISGGRFSDLFSSNNYDNRKWELYMNAGGLADGDAEMIATGVISGDFDCNNKSMTLRLSSYNSRKNKEVPNSKVTKSGYNNAPEKNIDAPIPVLYGDFSINSTYPSPLDQYVSAVKVPAIITNQYDQANSVVIAKPDSVAMHTLNDKNLYHYSEGGYSACDSANVTVTASTPEVQFSGITFYSFKNLTGAQDAVDRTP